VCVCVWLYVCVCVCVYFVPNNVVACSEQLPQKLGLWQEAARLKEGGELFCHRRPSMCVGVARTEFDIVGGIPTKLVCVCACVYTYACGCVCVWECVCVCVCACLLQTGK
jgi:hypothetical protein